MPERRRRRQTGKPVVLITGAAGGIGTALAAALAEDYTVVGLDMVEAEAFECLTVDLTSDDSVALALRTLRDRHGERIAAVVHLAAYFDFTGEDSPLYEKVNVEGTRRLLRGLQDFEVERLVYAGTMLVHQPCRPGERIDESAPIAPKWPYPQSKAAAEEAIRQEHGTIPYLLLRLAGVYDDETGVPTLTHQIARIYERSLKSRVYAGDMLVGQSHLHSADMVEAMRRAIDRRADLPPDAAILVGEPDPIGYGRLQDMLGRLIHGEDEWATMQVPAPLAKAGAWAEEHGEPLIPDAIDQGEKPFIRPFMIDMADDHYALDITRARNLLGWEPAHDLAATLPKIVAALKRDPCAWYEKAGITPPRWMQAAAAAGGNPERLRSAHERAYRAEHRRFLWAHFLNMALGTWLITSPPILGHAGTWLAWSDVASGVAVLGIGLLSLSWRLGLVRWAGAAVGTWLMLAPLVFRTESPAAYLNDTLVGALVFGFAVLSRPPPAVSAAAAQTGPDIPPGWDFSPSSWFQRLPIILLAFVGLYFSRHLAAYQLGHIDSAWEPFFQGSTPERNGTEEIVTSWVSEMWPVPDAGLGAVVYLLEILTGMIGSRRRWRTMPWLVIAFGFLIVPLGIVSITFIVIQPILLGTWCTLCLIGAAAMLLQIPYSLDELVATGQFLYRRKKAGRSLLRVLFVGDSDEGDPRPEPDDFERPFPALLKDTFGGGVSLPWNLALCLAIGVWLMFTRLTLGSAGGMANADHLIGALAVTVTVAALAEIARPVRFLNIGLGIALLITPFAFGAGLLATLASLACGAGLIAFSLRRGPIRRRYGSWGRYLV